MVRHDQHKFHRGEVFTSKKCEKSASPKHGRTGWRVVGDSNVPVLQKVFCDAKNGTAKWLTLDEFQVQKAERSRNWKKTKGPADWVTRRKRWAILEHHGPCFPEVVHFMVKPHVAV